MSLWEEFIKGIWKENPIFRTILALCPTMAVTTGVVQAIGMGLAVVFVLTCSNVILSLFRKLIPIEARIPIFIVIIASFVTVVKLVMAAEFPTLKENLGIFLPLIAVNCIIMGRAEAFASKNPPIPSLCDGLGMGLGFTLALCIIASIREIIGNGTWAGIPLTYGLEPYTQSIMILAPGGFLTIGLLLAFFNWRGNLQKEREKQ